MTKPRILILENSIAVTGALTSIVRSSLYLKDSFDFIFVLPTKSSALPYLKNSGLNCYELNMREIRKDFFSLAIYIPALLINAIKLRRLVTQLKIDLILVNDFYNLLPAVYRFFGGKTNYLCYVRFRPSKFWSPLVGLWTGIHYRYAKFIIAVSNIVLKELPYHQKVIVIANELPQQEISYQTRHTSILLFPGNYIIGKGQQYAIESFAYLSSKYPEWILRFVGGDMGLTKNKSYKDDLRKRSEELGITKRVQWGDFSENILQEYLNAAIVLNFSESESFSLTCMEGMYCGRSVIATRCGGPEEIIDHQVNGLLVPVGDISSMTTAIEFLINNPDRMDKMGLNAYFSVRDRFSNQNTCLRLKQVYFETLN